jgi:hypothetical protein
MTPSAPAILHATLPALVPLALAGCVFGPSDADRLDEARRRWAAQGIEHYVMTVSRGCFCAGPYRVEVRVTGTGVQRTDLDTGQPVTGPAAAWFPDVPGLFRLVEEAFRTAKGPVTVRFHPTRGYPTDVQVDPLPNAIDDEYAYTVSAFQALP